MECTTSNRYAHYTPVWKYKVLNLEHRQHLGIELGRAEAMRSVRREVDAQLHALGWLQEQLHAGLPEDQLHTERGIHPEHPLRQTHLWMHIG